MSNVIWKYQLQHGADSYLIPRGATPVFVSMQRGSICVWMLVDSDARNVIRKIHIRGTGHDISDEDGTHIGSVLDGEFVWHVFDGGVAE